MQQSFYRWFSTRRLTALGRARKHRIEQSRLGFLHRYALPGGELTEIGPGDGSFAAAAVSAGWRYRAIDASAVLADRLRAKGLDVRLAVVPPIDQPTAGCDVLYADQVLEHMPGIEAAREFVAEAYRCLRPGGVFFVVVPDYMKERAFFWDVDYTHNFVTTERRVRQLLYDGGFELECVVRSIGAATGPARDALAALSLLVNLPGVDAVSRYTRMEESLFRIRKNLFETLTIVARKPGKAS